MKLFLPDGCCHIIEGTEHNAFYSANLILLDTEMISGAIHELEKNFDSNSLVIRIIFDGIDHHLHLVKLERLHLMKTKLHR